MHSGFGALRKECPMELGLVTEAALSEETQANIRRIVQLWNDLRRRYAGQGPFLLGAWSIADAFYTPVATRFRSYGVRTSDYGDEGLAAAYVETVLNDPDYLAWRKAALEA
jgi:glutathione S-transferase